MPGNGLRQTRNTEDTSNTSMSTVTAYMLNFSLWSFVYVVQLVCGVLVDASVRRGSRSCINFLPASSPMPNWACSPHAVTAKGWAPQQARASGYFFSQCSRMWRKCVANGAPRTQQLQHGRSHSPCRTACHYRAPPVNCVSLRAFALAN